MAYTPQLSRRSSATLKRIAWALSIPMTKALEHLIEDSVHTVDRQNICLCCKESSVCDSCAFWDAKNLSKTIRLRDRIKKPDYEKIYRGSRVHVCLVRESGSPKASVKINTPRDVYNLVGKHMSSSDREVVLSILLANDASLIGVEKVAVGTLDQCIVTQRELFKSAILANAASIILCHCHPSGSRQMSVQDKKLSAVMYKAGQILGIQVNDHILIAGSGYVSHREMEDNVF
jgi:DNA repair protein RadC